MLAVTSLHYGEGGGGEHSGLRQLSLLAAVGPAGDGLSSGGGQQGLLQKALQVHIAAGGPFPPGGTPLRGQIIIVHMQYPAGEQLCQQRRQAGFAAAAGAVYGQQHRFRGKQASFRLIKDREVYGVLLPQNPVMRRICLPEGGAVVQGRTARPAVFFQPGLQSRGAEPKTPAILLQPCQLFF